MLLGDAMASVVGAWGEGVWGVLALLALLVIGIAVLEVVFLAALMPPGALRALAHKKTLSQLEAVDRLRALMADPEAFQKVFPKTSEALEALRDKAQDPQAFQKAFPQTSEAVERLRELVADPKSKFPQYFPHTTEVAVGGGWWLISYPSPMFVIGAAKRFQSWCRTAVWSFRGNPGVMGYVALTIDDAPGRGDTFMDEVMDLLDEYGAKATWFMISGDFCGKEHLVRKCVKRGHELGNHGGEDCPYHKHSERDFEEVLMHCEGKMAECGFRMPDHNDVEDTRKKWFRPPHGRCSDAMRKVLQDHGYTIAMCDVFGMDTHCGEPYVSSYVLDHAVDGSVVLMHLPEKGFREHNLEAIETVLRGFKKKGLKCVTLSKMHNLAYV